MSATSEAVTGADARVQSIVDRRESLWSKAIYKLRAQTAEWVNAETRNHGFQQMPVRGLKKCRIVAVLHAIAHNVFRAVRLCAAAPAARA